MSADNTWLFSEYDFIYKSPSRAHFTVEQDLKARESIADFIIRLGSALKLDARTIFVATIYTNRFYMKRPITQSKYFVALAAVTISCKLNDTYRLPDSIAITACKLKNPNLIINENSPKFWQWRDELLYREELLLKELNFELMVDLPYDIRNMLIDLPNNPGNDNEDELFYNRKVDIIKNTTALIESISSLPILLSFDINVVFATMLMVITLEAQAKFNIPIKLPKHYIANNFKIELLLCRQCYKYLMKLIGYCQRDPRNISNKAICKRMKPLSDADFSKIVDEPHSSSLPDHKHDSNFKVSSRKPLLKNTNQKEPITSKITSLNY